MGTVLVVMPGHVSQNCSYVGLVDDQQVIQPFPADGADESFGERVRPRRPHRRANHPGADTRENAVEGGGRTSRPDQRIRNVNRPADPPDPRVAAVQRSFWAPTRRGCNHTPPSNEVDPNVSSGAVAGPYGR